MPSRISKGRASHKFDQFSDPSLTSSQMPMLMEEEKALVFADDAYYKKSSRAALPLSNKINSSFNYAPEYGPEYGPQYTPGYSEDEPRASGGFSTIGKKSQTKWSQNLKDLRWKIGFSSWQQTARRLAILGIFLGIFALLAVSAVAVFVVNQYNEAPDISQTSLFQFKESSSVYARDGKTKIFEFYGDGKREYVNIDEIPKNMQLAMIALEDRFFYRNEAGIPWRNLGGASIDCARIIVTNAEDDCRGASGITQQLVKNAQGDWEQTPSRKIRELFTAIKLHQEGLRQDGNQINKDDILELYLNWVFFGRNSYGVQEASRSFFGRDINMKNENGDFVLSDAEACYLAALVQNPSNYAGSINNPESRYWQMYEARKNECLEILAGQRYDNYNVIGDGEAFFIPDVETLEAEKERKVEFIAPKFDDQFPHFREYVQLEIVKFLQANGLNAQALNRNGYKIITTIDPELQKQVEGVVKDAGDDIRAVGGDNASAMVLDGPTGQILAMVGSLDYNNEEIKGKVNVATTPQQPGSSIKPYVYASAFNQGFNPGTILMDTQTTFEGNFKPKNFSQNFSGPRSIHYALSNSLNIPAVKGVFLSAGVGEIDARKALDNWFDFSESAGIRFPCQFGDGDPNDESKTCENTPETGQDSLYRNRCFLGAAIGGCEVTMVSHITGVNTFLQEGNLRTASPFISIKDKDDNELYTPENRNKLYPHEDAKIKPTVARQLALVMADQNRPEFFQYQSGFTIPGWQLAGKTGTTDDNKDTWMVGGSPYYTTTVWAGRTDNKPMAANVQASNLALPIWNKIQNTLHKNESLETYKKEPKEFSSDGLKQVLLDPKSGFFVNSGGAAEWLSDEQIEILQTAQGRVASPEYNPRKRNIFENRSSVITRSVVINKLDGKLAVEGKTLEENVAQTVCTDFVGEFPETPGWSESVNAWGGGGKTVIERNLDTGEEREVFLGNGCPTEKSDEDQLSQASKQPEIVNESGLKSGAPAPNPIRFTAKGVLGKKITKAALKIDGFTVKSYDDPRGTNEITLSLDPDEVKLSGLRASDGVNITFEVEDNKGSKNAESFTNVRLSGGPSNNSLGASGSNSQGNNSNPTSALGSTVSGEVQVPSVTSSSMELSVVLDRPVIQAPQMQLIQGGVARSCNASIDPSNPNRYSCQVSTQGLSGGLLKIQAAGEDINVPPLNVQLQG